MKQLWTTWGEHLDPEQVLVEYPRPQLRRDAWTNLNGYWDYQVTSLSEKEIPSVWAGKILVPFSPECALSGVGRQILPEEYLWYHRSISGKEISERKAGERVLLHFGGIDQTCYVYVNGTQAGAHTGGYLPFTVDITEFLDEERESQEIVLRVRDVSDTSWHARGKQKLQRGGMYYTAQSGIWQTVWMELVPEIYIKEIQLVPDMQTCRVRVRVSGISVTTERGKEDRTRNKEYCTKEANRLKNESKLKEELQRNEKPECKNELELKVYPPAVFEMSREILPEMSQKPLMVLKGEWEKEFLIEIPEGKLWNDKTPWIYPLEIQMGEDHVMSYFALREISIAPAEKNIPRIFLNGEPIYLKSVLDQGYWPESLMTPPSEEAMLFDISEMKRFGFNTIRKHAKLEPDRFYYNCDRLGMLVWQDMVNGGSPYKDWFVTYMATFLSWAGVPVKDRHARLLSRKDERGKREFRWEMKETVRNFGNHPSLIAWTIFNEGWGQFDTKNISDYLKKLDPSRLIDSTSGWFDQGCGDFRSVHYYFLTFRMKTEKKRAFVLSEFGGLPYMIPEHNAGEKVYGYGKRFRSREELTEAYHKLEARMEEYLPQGLNATVYTQWTDIEDEVNGIYTWDRKVQKIAGKDGWKGEGADAFTDSAK